MEYYSTIKFNELFIHISTYESQNNYAQLNKPDRHMWLHLYEISWEDKFIDIECLVSGNGDWLHAGLKEFGECFKTGFWWWRYNIKTKQQQPHVQ